MFKKIFKLIQLICLVENVFLLESCSSSFEYVEQDGLKSGLVSLNNITYELSILIKVKLNVAGTIPDLVSFFILRCWSFL